MQQIEVWQREIPLRVSQYSSGNKHFAPGLVTKHNTLRRGRWQEHSRDESQARVARFCKNPNA